MVFVFKQKKQIDFKITFYTNIFKIKNFKNISFFGLNVKSNYKFYVIKQHGESTLCLTISCLKYNS